MTYFSLAAYITAESLRDLVDSHHVEHSWPDCWQTRWLAGGGWPGCGVGHRGDCRPRGSRRI